MARRSKDWNEGLAEDLQDLAFARELLAAAVEDGVPLQQALGKIHENRDERRSGRVWLQGKFRDGVHANRDFERAEGSNLVEHHRTEA